MDGQMNTHRFRNLALVAVLLFVGFGMTNVRRDKASQNLVYDPITHGIFSRDSTNALIDAQPRDPVFVTLGVLVMIGGIGFAFATLRYKDA